MEITLAPLSFFWHKQAVYEFYQQVAESAIDRVYLGEVVCAKRRELKAEDWLEIATLLQNSGKTVVLSTLALIESASDLMHLKRLCQQGEWLVEANDMAAVHYLAEQQLPFCAGPSMNLYSAEALQVMHRLGLQRWVMPVELSLAHLQQITQQLQQLGINQLETEIFSYGYLPLAYSARCFSARVNDVSKDQCGFACLQSPQGIPLATQEGDQLFVINGIQSMSGYCYDICDQWQVMQQHSVAAMRLSAHNHDLFAVAQQLKKAIQQNSVIESSQLHGRGYWFGKAGIV